MLPEKVGPFRVVGQLGAGGMGVVYRGVDEVGIEVAIKTVRGARQSLLAAIRREIRALMRVRHPGVVRVFAEGLAGGLPWYAMELLVGGTLREHHQKIWDDAGLRSATGSTAAPARKNSPVQVTVVERPRRMTQPDSVPKPPPGRRSAGAGRLGDAVRPIARLCQTLAFLHGEGIVHRDLKPDNVFLRAGELPILMDFGIATLVGGGAREVLDPSAGLSGTVGYMAPEQILGERTDARADLYSVGCLLYELVTGLSAFGGPTQEVVSHHVHSEPIRPSELVENLPPELEELILRLMAKRPRDRLGHADDVVVGLEPWTGRLAMPIGDTGEPLVPRVYLYRPDLVGRQEIREKLNGKLIAAAEGVGGLVHLGGESGVGKTALATELMRVAIQAGFAVIAGECQAKVDAADDGGGALHPLRPFLQGVADRCLERGVEATRRLLGNRAAVLSPFEPALLPLVNGAPRLLELPADAARQRLFQALSETIGAFTEERGLLLVIDDIQWGDELTLGFLAQVDPEWFTGKRLLVCTTHRSDEVSPLLRRTLEAPAGERVELGRLDARTVEAMVGGMLALAAPPPDIVDFLFVASEGNPFFVAEYLRAAAGEGLLARDAGRWRMARQGAGGFRLDTPRSLRELVGDRLERLPVDARGLADAAAVLGREVAVDILLETAGTSEHDPAASHALSELLVRNVLETDGPNVRFVHDKLREVAYDKLVESRRRELHAAAGACLEARLAGHTDPASLYPALAHHFDVAGLEPQALDYLEKSGAHALATSAHAAANDAFARALALAGPNVDSRRLSRWKHGLAKAQFALGNMGHAETHARAALAALGRPLPASKGGWARLLVTEVLRQTWRILGPKSSAELLPVPRREDLTEAAQLAGLLTHRYYYMGDTTSIIGASLLSVNLAEKVDAGSQVPHAYAWLGYVSGLLRRHELAHRYFELAYLGADRAGDVLAKSFAVNVEAVYHIGFGAFDVAARRASTALELADGDAQSHELATNVLGHVAFYTGQLDDSLRRYSTMLTSARKRANQQHVTWGLFTQARAMVAQGRHAEARPLLAEARTRLVERPERDSEIIVLGLLAAAEAHAGDPAAAREAVRGVLERVRGGKPGGFSVIDGYDGAVSALVALARTRGNDAELERDARELVAAMSKLARMFPMVAPYAAFHRGELEALRGRSAKAEKAFTSAKHLADEMGMHGLRLRAEAALERPRAS